MNYSSKTGGTKGTISTFVADNGVEIPAVTTDGIREIDRIAMEETGPNLYQMMENAGRNLASLAVAKAGDHWREARIVILAGTGGNGGGGICAARHLANRGAHVRLCISAPKSLGGVPAFQRHIYMSAKGVEVSFDQLDDKPAGLIIDAIIGYGLRLAPYGIPREMIRWANRQDAVKLSLDVPSGIDSTTGAAPGIVFRPDVTMTLALPKTGLLPELTGELFLADIGIPAGTFARLNVPYRSPFDGRYRIPLAARDLKARL